VQFHALQGQFLANPCRVDRNGVLDLNQKQRIFYISPKETFMEQKTILIIRYYSEKSPGSRIVNPKIAQKQLTVSITFSIASAKFFGYAR